MSKVLDTYILCCYTVFNTLDRKWGEKQMNELIGKRIKDRREKLGMKQEDLAIKSKVSRGTISALENGKCEDTLVGTLAAIASALDTTVDSFFA